MPPGSPEFWGLCATLAGLALALLRHFSAWLPPISTWVEIWLACGLLILAYHSGRGGRS